MLLSEWYCKARNNARQDIQKLRSSIKLESLMNQAVEAVINGLSDHFSSWNQLGI
jgi:hypothetical protein